MTNEQQDKAVIYFDNIFSGIDTKQLPTPEKETDNLITANLSYEFQLENSFVAKICEKTNIGLNTLFNGVFSIVVSSYSNTNDAIFVSINPDLNQPIPLYCKFDKYTSIAFYLEDLQNQILSTIENYIISFDELSKKYSITSDLIFAYQSDFNENFPKHKIAFAFNYDNGKCTITANYRSDLYNQESIKNILHSYETTLIDFGNCHFIKEN